MIHSFARYSHEERSVPVSLAALRRGRFGFAVLVLAWRLLDLATTLLPFIFACAIRICLILSQRLSMYLSALIIFTDFCVPVTASQEKSEMLFASSSFTISKGT